MHENFFIHPQGRNTPSPVEIHPRVEIYPRVGRMEAYHRGFCGGGFRGDLFDRTLHLLHEHARDAPLPWWWRWVMVVVKVVVVVVKVVVVVEVEMGDVVSHRCHRRKHRPGPTQPATPRAKPSPHRTTRHKITHHNTA